MNTQHYVVQAWKTEDRIAKEGAVDYEGSFIADTAADAAKKLVEAKQVSGRFYVEVHLEGNNVDCWGFTDTSPELMS